MSAGGSEAIERITIAGEFQSADQVGVTIELECFLSRCCVPVANCCIATPITLYGRRMQETPDMNHSSIAQISFQNEIAGLK